MDAVYINLPGWFHEVTTYAKSQDRRVVFSLKTFMSDRKPAIRRVFYSDGHTSKHIRYVNYLIGELGFDAHRTAEHWHREIMRQIRADGAEKAYVFGFTPLMLQECTRERVTVVVGTQVAFLTQAALADSFIYAPIGA